MAKTIIDSLVEKSLSELQKPDAPSQKSRTWSSPIGYKYLVQWSNLVLLRYLVRLYTASLPKSEYRRKAQLDDAARSAVRNIEEGYKRSNTATYLEFIGFSQGSLEEVLGDVHDLVEDGFLISRSGSSLKDMKIDLGELHEALLGNTTGVYRSKKEDKESVKEFPHAAAQGFTYIPITVLYSPLERLTASDLTYEMFYELIKKTDFLLRKLVISLEKKLSADKKYYEVEKLKIKDAIKNRK